MGPEDVDILIGLLGEMPRRMRGPPLRQQDEAPKRGDESSSKTEVDGGLSKCLISMSSRFDPLARDPSKE